MNQNTYEVIIETTIRHKVNYNSPNRYIESEITDNALDMSNHNYKIINEADVIEIRETVVDIIERGVDYID